VREGGSANNGLNFRNDGTISIEGEFTGAGNSDILTNNGSIENEPTGFFGMGSESVFENSGTFTNLGDALLQTVTNDGLILNSETLKVVKTVSNNNNFTNNGTFSLSGEITNSGNGSFRNNGPITMGEDFGGEGTVEGKITNSATFENNDSITVTIGSIANTGSLVNNGDITNSDQISNSGNGEITNIGTITNDNTVNNNGNGKITNIGTITNNSVINNNNIINNCGTISGNAPVGGTLNGYCPATLIVVEDTVPNNSVDFAFTSTTLSPASFSLDDDSQGPLQNTRTFADLVPGTYNVTETYNSSYIAIPICDDGSSVKSIGAQNAETITCTFTNLFDSDADGLAPQIDTNLLSFSNNFDDAPLGNNGKTNGTIIDRKSLAVWVTDEPNPSGVKIRAVNGPSQNATVSVCNGGSTISLNSGDGVIITCGSVDLSAISGSPQISFNAQNGVRSSAVLPEGNSVFFEPTTFKFSVPPENSNSLPITIEAATRIIVEFPQNEQNAFTFEPETVTFTSDSDNQGELAIIIGDKEEKIQPNSSISPLIAIDQSITVNQNQSIEITLSSLGGTGSSQTSYEIVTAPIGQLVQDQQNPAIFKYTPNAGFAGLDKFEFKAIKGTESSNTGTVTIKVPEVLKKQKISGGYVGKFTDSTFTAIGDFKIGKETFKKVSIGGTFHLVKKDAKCFNVLGSGMMDFKKGNTLNLEFSAQTCSKIKFLSKLDGTITYKGGTGIFDVAKGTGEFSQVDVLNSLIGKLSGDLFLKK
ncbi:MAG TPA: hypothetical protein VLF17_01230, partial [Candidatus Nitrosotenuis sp.]|nr:hypothetical protein [Candidatus Nitrosotenuis sp.]